MACAMVVGVRIIGFIIPLAIVVGCCCCCMAA